MTINLQNHEVEIRENRLHSITGFSGSARSLCDKSNSGTLVERERSFTQCATCSSVTALCQLAMIQDAAVVNHAPLGCAGDFAGFNFINRAGQALRGLPVSNVRLISSNLQEEDMIYGGRAKLESAIKEAWQRYRPRAIFITTSCAAAIIGDDLDSTSREAEHELGIPVVPVYCEGFRTRIWASGFDSAYHAILSRIVKPPRQKRPDLVNVINFWGSDTIGPLFKRIGLEANYIVPFNTIEQLEHISEAAATVQVCSTLGTYLAAGLEEHFGVTEVKTPPPYGITGSDAWFTELGRVVGKEQEVANLIREEKASIGSELAELRRQLTGKTAYVGAGAVHGHSIIAILQELGMKIIGACTWHHDPVFDNHDPKADSLAHIVEQYGDFNFSVCNKQSYELVNLLNRLRPDIFIVRHPGMAIWGARLGIPSFHMEDEHFGLGYQGIVNYGRKIADAIANPAYVKNLARHSHLPYSTWWLEQEPFSLLGGETL